jgi:signal transduction histidine kinase/ligand-binding sensor domain-containing protein
MILLGKSLCPAILLAKTKTWQSQNSSSISTCNWILISFFFLLGSLFSFTIKAQDLFDKAYLLTLKDGKKWEEQYCVAADDLGFIWFGGPNGLNVYDGNSMYTIPFGEGERQINGKRVFQILRSDSNHMLVATDKGICRINVRNFGTENLVFTARKENLAKANHIQQILMSKSGLIWVMSMAGVHLVNREFKIHKSWYFPDHVISNAKAVQPDRMLLFPDDHIWLVSVDISDNSNASHKPNILELGKDYLDFKKLKPNQNLLEGKHILFINLNDTLGLVISGSINENANVYAINLISKQLQYLNNPGIKFGNWSPYIMNVSPEMLAVYPSYGNSIYTLNLRSGIWHKNLVPYNATVKDLIYFEGTYYAATERGILVKSTSIFNFNSNNCVSRNIKKYQLIYQVQSLDNLFLLTAGNGSIIYYDPAMDSCTYHIPNKGKGVYYFVEQIFKMDSNRWIISGGEINFSFNPLSGKVSTVLGHSDYTIEDTNSAELFKDSYGYIWFGFYNGGGICRWHPYTGQYKYYKNLGSDNLTHHSDYSRLIEDDNGDMWFGVPGGGMLVKWNRKLDSFSFHYSNSQDSTNFIPSSNGIAKDKFGQIWLSTNGYGLIYFHPDKMQFKHYLSKDRLHDYANNVVVDCLNIIWISSANGLVRVDLANNTEYQFYEVHGLPVRDISQVDKVTGDSCLLYLTTHKGFVIFDPTKFVIPPPKKELILRYVKINDKNYLEDMDKPISLNYEDNNLEIQFGQSNLLDGFLNEYFYKFDGEGSDWTYMGHDPLLRLVGLNHGVYKLWIKVCVNGGICFEQHMLDFSIQTPFWKNPWLYAILSFVFLSLIMLIFRIRYSLKLAKIQKERDLEILRNKIAQDIHDEVGSSLTRISLSAQLATRLSHLNFDEIKARINKLGEEAKMASAQLREIVFSINPDFDRFEELQNYLKEQTILFWEGRNVEIQFELPAEGPNTPVHPDVKRQLILIFKEIQNNIAKHANPTSIKVHLSEEKGGTYILEVVDDGIGFLLDHKKGQTNGLKSIQKRAQAIYADIKIDSIPQKGTSIILKGKLQLNS